MKEWKERLIHILDNYSAYKFAAQKGDLSIEEEILAIGEALDAVLNNDEREVIKRNCIILNKQYQIAMEMNYSERTIRRIKANTLRKLEIALKGC